MRRIKMIKHTKDKVIFSCEVFPPKRDDDIYEIFKTLDKIKTLKPDFISVTYGAGGSNSKKTATIAAYIQHICEVEALAHMTAVGMDDEKLHNILDELSSKQIHNILALRGDKPRDMSDEDFVNRKFKYASDLIPEINKAGEFLIAGACYPEVHPESLNQEDDLKYLKHKVDMGMNCLITQMFFDNNVFYDFMDKAGKVGINVPVHAGIMPITAANQLGTSVKLSGSSVPQELSNLIAKYGDNPDDMKKAGIEYAVNQIKDLKNNGVAGIHLYTMNKADTTVAIYNETFA
ncbi:MAG: methylenetetrahydrofolate reductase [NAD(P)H] [Lachnospiraceae bacterium]|nr:methylenetetrahydrofolate reductase [NAD(P)H] [Lachnospiraceae bacterium]